jgi:hypothetical protein
MKHLILGLVLALSTTLSPADASTSFTHKVLVAAKTPFRAAYYVGACMVLGVGMGFVTGVKILEVVTKVDWEGTDPDTTGK